ncbi:unnamed protein product [marine sediment metagenome]|jgi:hypothetical protein|uniref:Mobilization protein n=1 Tax=marine sediment metagenome TaxID=412755 RepID=X1RWT5_9ZZZZ
MSMQQLQEKQARIVARVRTLKAEKRKQDARALAAIGELVEKAAQADAMGAYWAARWLLDQAHQLPPTRRKLAEEALAPLLASKPL